MSSLNVSSLVPRFSPAPFFFCCKLQEIKTGARECLETWLECVQVLGR